MKIIMVGISILYMSFLYSKIMCLLANTTTTTTTQNENALHIILLFFVMLKLTRTMEMNGEEQHEKGEEANYNGFIALCRCEFLHSFGKWMLKSMGWLFLLHGWLTNWLDRLDVPASSFTPCWWKTWLHYIFMSVLEREHTDTHSIAIVAQLFILNWKFLSRKVHSPAQKNPSNCIHFIEQKTINAQCTYTILLNMAYNDNVRAQCARLLQE